MKRLLAQLLLALALMLLCVFGAEGNYAQFDSALRKGSLMALPQEGRVRAPELSGARSWLNTDKPLSLAALRGKIVLLDFWTYGCINCIHIIPDLKRLEAKYSKQLVVIGVHSAKFENEKETENIRRIILRYEIEHPVVNDADFRIWNEYAVRGWPTLVLIDPEGYVIGAVSGEGHYDLLDRAIGRTVEEYRKRGMLDEQPLRLVLERAKVGDLPLAFPGKILADARGDRLFIADSNHNRIVVTRLDGTLLYAIGAGEKGWRDGSFESAQFYRPQGMALDGDTLYVADTENHLIRRVDLRSRVVETIAGTGKQSLVFEADGAAREVSLNSPWDMHLAGRTLYIAMAGPHQIWSLELEAMRVSVFAGSGREARADGSLDESAFSQPSGITGQGSTLYVADSEANIIREIDTRKRSVQTLAGGDLFDFGDRDGEGDAVRLQHPLGVLAFEGKVFIADTYNHRIKLLEPATGKVKTFSGTGRPGQTDGVRAVSFYEPGGLSIAREKLYVADTNNHAVRVVDLKTGETSTLMLKGLRPPANKEIVEDAVAGRGAEEVTVGTLRIGANLAATLIVDVGLPKGYRLNEAAPHRYSISVESGKEVLALTGGASPVKAARTAKDLELPLRIALRAFSPGRASLRIELTLYYCREDNTGTCRIKTLAWRAPIEVTAGTRAPREIKIQGRVE